MKENLLKCSLVFITIATLTACVPEKCIPTACVTLIPTVEDVSSMKMYKQGTTYKFLSNSKDTLSFIASDIIYYEGSRDEGDQTEGCHYHYASLVNAKVKLTGTNNNGHIDFIVSTWRRTVNSKNMWISEICDLTLDKDSISTFFIARENPGQISVEEVTDTLLFSKKTIDSFKVVNKTYNDVYYVTNMSSSSYFRFYYHKDYGLLKLTTNIGETLELIK